MSDIVRHSSSDKLSTIRKLRDVVRELNQWVLVDGSSSMGLRVNEEQTRTQAARVAIKTLKDEGHRFRLMIFNDSVEIREDIPEPCGGTSLAGALRALREYKPARVTVASDGEPTDGHQACLDAAHSLGCAVDVIYIGPPNGPGAEFLASLASATNGRYASNDLATGGVKALTDNVRENLLALTDGGHRPWVL